MSAFKQWEVYWAFVPFDEGHGGKDRPVVVISSGKDARAVALFLSSRRPNNSYDVEIIDWLKSGLTEKTYTRAARRYALEELHAHYKMGRLMRLDQIRVAEVLALYDRLYT
ncbi:MAG: type II toxin-antitoxin system PemK/MazF family toxin [Oscillospiraceae bacterium]|jgi:hypothetical protein|nr:type II toxin-antitoxin system PemK/MazF family toxin [Oscillospiraceae bacterium]